MKHLAIDLLFYAAPVTTRAVEKLAMTRVAVRSSSTVRVESLAKWAYGFVKGHIDSVTALTRLLRRENGRRIHTLEEERW